MSTLKVDAIRHNSATSDAITTAADGTCTAKVTNSLSHRRLNHNGAMLVNQRGNKTGATASGYHGLDRYYTQMNDNNNGTWSITQAADVPDGYGFKYSLEYAPTATTSHADRYLMTVYRMEGVDCQLFNYGTANAKSVTLSFWIKCSKAGNFQVNFENEENPDAGYQVQQTINSAGTWEKKVVTVPGDTTKALTYGVQKAFCFDIVYSAFGSYASVTPTAAWSTLNNSQRGGHCNMDLFDSTSNYVKITGVQLELGDHATDFEHRSYGDELAQCQRYCVVYGGSNSVHLGCASAYNATNINVSLHLPVSMRAGPGASTVTSGGNWVQAYMGASGNTSNASISVTDVDANHSTMRMYLQNAHSGLTAGQALWVHTIANAQLILSADL